MRWILVAASLLAAAPCAADWDGPDKEVNDLLNQGYPLTAFEHLSSFPLEPGKGQDLSQFYCFIGRYDKAVRRAKPADGDDPPLPDQDLTIGLEPVDAIAAIVSEARKHRIILLNEAHNVGAHRAFARRVVRALAKEGFGYLGMESLAPESPDLEHPESVPRSIGYYSNDPAYASIIRAAAAEHYHLIAYESINEGPPTSPCDADTAETWVHADPKPTDGDTAARIMHREKNEACNLTRTIQALPPNARILIYAGYSHIQKQPVNGIPWMAAYLQAYLGEQVFSIDQTFGDANLFSARTAKSAPIMTQLFAHLDIKSETAIRQSEDSYFVPRGQEGSIDMEVLHPDTGDRANWWRPDDALTEMWVDAPDREHGWPHGLVEATIPGMGPDKVPLDQAYVGEDGVMSVRLLLPKGQAAIVEEIGDKTIKPVGLIDVTPGHETPAAP